MPPSRVLSAWERDTATATTTTNTVPASPADSTSVAGPVGSSVDEVGAGVCQGDVLRVCGAAGAVGGSEDV